MLFNIALFTLALIFLIKSADLCIDYSSKIARAFKLSEFMASFFIVAMISVLPEGAISIISAIEGDATIGIATVFGSIIADMTLVFGLVAIFSRTSLVVRSEVIRKDFLYLLLILLPVILGVDGTFSRIDGVVLILGGLLFIFTLSIESGMFKKTWNHVKRETVFRHSILFLLSMAVLLVSAHFLVTYGIRIATELDISVLFIGLIVAAIGTCTPELFFSIKAVRSGHEELALGDLLGTIIIDATLLIGVTALIRPIAFEPNFLLNLGVFMFVGGLLLLWFIKTDKVLTKREGVLLLLFYLIFLITQVLLCMHD